MGCNVTRLFVTAVSVSAMLIGATACTPSSTDDSEQPPRGCGECATETQDLQGAIETLKGVRNVARLEYTPGRNVTRLPNVSMDLEVAKGSTQRVTDGVAEAAWKSRITPLESVRIASMEPGGDVENTTVTFAKNRLAEFEKKWGPRPVE